MYNFKNKKEIKNQSILKNVSPKDEWCIEAYMKTDYSKLQESDFIREVRYYVSFIVKFGD